MKNKHNECKCEGNKMEQELKAFMQEIREGFGVLMSCMITMEMDIYTREVEKENKNKMKLLMTDVDRELIRVYSNKYLNSSDDKLEKTEENETDEDIDEDSDEETEEQKAVNQINEFVEMMKNLFGAFDK